MRIGLQRHFVESSIDLLRQHLNGLDPRLSVFVDRFRLDNDRRSEERQRCTAKGLLCGVVQARGNDRNAERCTEGDPRGASLQLAQTRIAVRRPLRKDGDRTPAFENRARAGERLAVAMWHRHSCLCVLLSIDRNRIERANDPADQRHPEQRRLPQEGDRPRSNSHQKYGIDERVGMIDCENHR